MCNGQDVGDQIITFFQLQTNGWRCFLHFVAGLDYIYIHTVNIECAKYKYDNFLLRKIKFYEVMLQFLKKLGKTLKFLQEIAAI